MVKYKLNISDPLQINNKSFGNKYRDLSTYLKDNSYTKNDSFKYDKGQIMKVQQELYGKSSGNKYEQKKNSTRVDAKKTYKEIPYEPSADYVLTSDDILIDSRLPDTDRFEAEREWVTKWLDDPETRKRYNKNYKNNKSKITGDAVADDAIDRVKTVTYKNPDYIPGEL